MPVLPSDSSDPTYPVSQNLKGKKHWFREIPETTSKGDGSPTGPSLMKYTENTVLSPLGREIE